MGDEQLTDRERLILLEQKVKDFEKLGQEIKDMIRDLGNELRNNFVPKGEYDEARHASDARFERLEARVRDLEAAPKGGPAWVQWLLVAFSLVAGGLISLLAKGR